MPRLCGASLAPPGRNEGTSNVSDFFGNTSLKFLDLKYLSCLQLANKESCSLLSSEGDMKAEMKQRDEIKSREIPENVL